MPVPGPRTTRETGLNLRFVEAFYWVASLKSMSRAAQKLFITQSAMSSRCCSIAATGRSA
jgi:hypothetical protein